eukprot:scaffold24515_cov112-Isochrysis_galbana.AAC.1
MLPCGASRGRFGDSRSSMTVSFGAEAEGAARASAGRFLWRAPGGGLNSSGRREGFLMRSRHHLGIAPILSLHYFSLSKWGYSDGCVLLAVCPLGCAGGEETSLGSLERFVSNASNGARVIWGFSEVLVLRARKVGVGAYPGDSEKEPLHCIARVVFKAHPTVYGRLIGSRVGANWVGLKRAGSADPMEEMEMTAGALRRLVCAFFVCCCAHVRKVMSEASLPKTTSRKGW